MKYSLLDLTKNILSSMDSDEINSINDTVESQQVVQIIKTVYNDIVSRGDPTSIKTPFTLDSSGDALLPVLMTKPENIVNIEWIRYNGAPIDSTEPSWVDVDYLTPGDFIRFVQNYSIQDQDVGTMTYTVNGFNVVFNYKTDGFPRYYTSFDDNVLIFDSFDSQINDTLQTSRTLCYGLRDVTFSEVDGFIPELSTDQFSLLLNEAKSLAWAELKQSPHPKAEQYARRNWSHLARTRRHTPSGAFDSGAHARQDGPNFARK